MLCLDYLKHQKSARQFRFSKAYDCLPHKHLIAKLEGNGLDKHGFNLVNDYSSLQRQKRKYGSSY